jgi:DNA-binding MurR/RpiR family transcriptional regulator
MQKAMQEEVRIKYSIADRFEEALEETDEELSDSKRVYNQTLKNLNDTYGYLPETVLDEAVNEILAAKRIGVVGTRVGGGAGFDIADTAQPIDPRRTFVHSRY